MFFDINVNFTIQKLKSKRTSLKKYTNMLPIQIWEAKNSDTFKTMTKEWIWKNIPSY